MDRLHKEVSIIRTPAFYKKPFPWARERFFSRRSTANSGGRVLLAYSIDVAGRIVRGWYLRSTDLEPRCTYFRKPGCPVEAAWLESLKPGAESEPAWLFLRPEPHVPNSAAC